MTEENPPKSEQTNAKLLEKKQLKNSILNICEPMCINLRKEKPNNIVSYMINYLKNKYNYSSSLLKNEEKKELEQLKNDIQIFHDMDEHFYFVDSQLKAKKDVKIIEKKGKGPKIKPRLPPDDIIPSDDEDLNDPDEIDERLDDPDYIKSNINPNFRPGLLENIIDINKEIKIKNNIKSPELFEFIKINLMKSPLFSELSLDILEKCINAMEEKKYNSMSEIIKQEDYNNNFYFILEGELECKMGFTIIKREGNKKKIEKYEPRVVKVYYPGDYFGELNLLYYIPNRGTIKALTDTTLYLLNKNVYKAILNNSFKDKKGKIILLLKNVPILQTLTDEEFEKLTQITKETTFFKGDIIIKENEFCNNLMILEEGNCIGQKIVEEGKIPIKTKDYREGQIFCEKALLQSEKSQESVIGNSEIVRFIYIDRYSFKNIFGSLEQILMRNLDLYHEYFPPLPEIIEEKPVVQPIGFENENMNPDNLQINNIEPQKNIENINNNNIEQEVNNNIVNINIDELTQKNNQEKEELKKLYEEKINNLNEQINSLKNKLMNNNNNELDNNEANIINNNIGKLPDSNYNNNINMSINNNNNNNNSLNNNIERETEINNNIENKNEENNKEEIKDNNIENKDAEYNLVKTNINNENNDEINNNNIDKIDIKNSDNKDIDDGNKVINNINNSSNLENHNIDKQLDINNDNNNFINQINNNVNISESIKSNKNNNQNDIKNEIDNNINPNNDENVHDSQKENGPNLGREYINENLSQNNQSLNTNIMLASLESKNLNHQNLENNLNNDKVPNEEQNMNNSHNNNSQQDSGDGGFEKESKN